MGPSQGLTLRFFVRQLYSFGDRRRRVRCLRQSRRPETSLAPQRGLNHFGNTFALFDSSLRQGDKHRAALPGILTLNQCNSLMWHSVKGVFFFKSMRPELSNSESPPAKPGVYPIEIISGSALVARSPPSSEFSSIWRFPDDNQCFSLSGSYLEFQLLLSSGAGCIPVLELRRTAIWKTTNNPKRGKHSRPGENHRASLYGVSR
jgi:hypothetical protein